MKTTLLFLFCCGAACAAERNFDVVVYGGTAGGAIAAVSASREGLHTALVEPGGHLGGMVSGGLSWTDVGKKEVIGGYPLEFYLRVGMHYELGRFGQQIGWIHEPHVAEAIFRDMLKQAGVALFERTRLKEKGGVSKTGTKVSAIVAENGDRFTAKIFVDSTYEGDLMAQAGVTYTYGREGAAQYGETLAGVREKTPFHQFLVDVSPYDAQGQLLHWISPRRLPEPGTADKAVQSYNYRMCLSEDPQNQVPFPKPAGYDPAQYELLHRLIEARTKKEGRVPALGTLIKIDRIPNGKTDINNQGAFSTDFIGGSWDYPDASYARRAEIWDEHKRYQEGFFYYLANDPAVPEQLRSEMNHWGLAKDEFTDTGNWPNQLYVREARRMIGEYVMVQKDLQTDRTKPDPIGMGSYNSDSHNVERIVAADGFVRNEGDMQVPVQPYQIPYRIMLPKRAETTNLLVPVAFSASHVAYSSVRMEPQYMMLGQAAGVAARLAIASGAAVQQVDPEALRKRLAAQGVIFEYEPERQTRVLQVVRKNIR